MVSIPEITVEDELDNLEPTVVKKCPHLKKACRFRRIEPKIRDLKASASRVCKGCLKETAKSGTVAEAAQLWLCLACGCLFCGRYDKGHAAKHYDKAGETDCLMWNIDNYSCWCYICDDSIRTAPNRNEPLIQVEKYWRKHAAGVEVEEPPTVVADTRSLDYRIISPGLQNLGNTCFFNSVVQLLASVEQLHEILSPHPFIDRSSLEIKSTSNLTIAFSKVLNEIYSSDREKHVLKPNSLFGEVHRKFPQFTKGTQQDAQELFHYLLDGLKADESMLKSDDRPDLKRTRSRRRTTGEEEIEMTERVSRGPKQNVWKPANYIESIFEGRLASIVVCSACHAISTTHDQFEELSLSIVQEKQQSKERKGRFRAAFEDLSRKGRSSLSLTRSPSTRHGVSMSRAGSKQDGETSDAQIEAPSPRKLLLATTSSQQISMSEVVSEEEAEDAAAVEKQLKAHTFSMSEAKNRLLSFATTRKPSLDPVLQEDAIMSPSTPSLSRSPVLSRIPDIPPASAERLTYINKLLQEPEGLEPRGTIEDSLRDFTAVECLENDNAFACEECAKILHPPGAESTVTEATDEDMDRVSTNSSASMKDGDNASSESGVSPRTMLTPAIPATATSKARPKHIMRKAYKRFLVADLPNILILHLKRFQQSGKSIYSSMRKNDAVVSFDEELDMSPYLMPASSKDEVSKSARYRCIGAIVHIGTINSGHYVAYFLTHKVLGAGEVLTSEPGSKERQWVFASDALLRPCSWAEVSKSRAYMIFYERVA